MNRFAIVSVSDKTNLEPFVRGLTDLGIEILSTGGTAKYLTECGFKVKAISDHTGQQEILDGRVKTLHPLIHGGILARRDNPADMEQLREHKISPIDLVIVNLYPFTAKVREVETLAKPNHESLVEHIDIGGPTMIRAAAKNCRFVAPVCDPDDYEKVLEELRSTGDVSLKLRRQLSTKVFMTMSAYDGAIARYFSLEEELLDPTGRPKVLAPVESVVLRQRELLRYGENPHQHAALYQKVEVGNFHPKHEWSQLQGKELSYNNILDMQAALELFLELEPVSEQQQRAVIIKHLNPCGVALRPTLKEAFEAARACDPVSAFGGIVALSGQVDEETVQSILEGFVEVIVARAYTAGALVAFQKKPNIRVLLCDESKMSALQKRGWLTGRNAFSDYLLMTSDNELAPVAGAKVLTGKHPQASVIKDLELAWAVCKHVKSNAIVIAKNQQAIGIGAGQMNRVDSARIAIQRAKSYGHDISNSVAASDAFLPFPDTLEVLADAGATALVQPGGSIRDEDVTRVATERNVTLLVTGERHFRH